MSYFVASQVFLLKYCPHNVINLPSCYLSQQKSYFLTKKKKLGTILAALKEQLSKPGAMGKTVSSLEV
jgi:hypothetical protein